MSTVAVVVLAVVALLLLAMLVAGVRRSSAVRRPRVDDLGPRSHAEASRHREGAGQG
jgi:hypothetical protein